MKIILLHLILIAGGTFGCVGPRNGSNDQPRVETAKPPTNEEIAQIAERRRRQNETIQEQIRKKKEELEQLQKQRSETTGLSNDELKQKIQETDARIEFLKGEIDALLRQIVPLTPYYREIAK